MNSRELSEFDFDEMARLAQEDPQAFERRRQQMLDEVVEQASPELQQRMHGLQWQIDQVRAQTSSPMAACLRISKMMWDSVLEDNGLLENLQRLQSGQTVPARNTRPTATVINLQDITARDE